MARVGRRGSCGMYKAILDAVSRLFAAADYLCGKGLYFLW